MAEKNAKLKMKWMIWTAELEKRISMLPTTLYTKTLKVQTNQQQTQMAMAFDRNRRIFL